MKFLIRYIPLIFLALCTSVHAQDTSDIERSGQIWMEYKHHHKISGKLEFYNDGGYRINIPNTWNRLFVRPSVGFRPHRVITINGGLGLFLTFNEASANRVELRPWQGAVLHAPRFWRLLFTLIVRWEQRLNWAIDQSFNAVVKFRFMPAVDIPLNNATIKEGTWFGRLRYEWFRDVGSGFSEHFADRGRLTTGIGYKINPNLVVRGEYIFQRSLRTPVDIIKTSDHIFRIVVDQRFGFN